jgi:hypothetical protein
MRFAFGMPESGQDCDFGNIAKAHYGKSDFLADRHRKAPSGKCMPNSYELEEWKSSKFCWRDEALALTISAAEALVPNGFVIEPEVVEALRIHNLMTQKEKPT